MGTDPDAPRREAVHGIVPEGDSSCWLGELCPECGAMPERAGAEDAAVPCWRCGAVRSRTVEDGDVSAEDGGASGGAAQSFDGASGGVAQGGGSAHGPDDPGA